MGELRMHFWCLSWWSAVTRNRGLLYRINHKNYLKNGRVVTSPAVNITETDWITADGDVIGYDYLVIATGHNDLFPKTRQENLSQYQTGKLSKPSCLLESQDSKLVLSLLYWSCLVAEYEKIRSSKSVLIVGGGPSGVELAAEISVQLQTETKHTGLQEERLYTQVVISSVLWNLCLLNGSVGLFWKIAWVRDGHCFFRKKRLVGSVSVCDSRWLPPWFDQVEGSICKEDEEDRLCFRLRQSLVASLVWSSRRIYL